MSNVFPKGIEDQIAFCESHMLAWQANPGAIGLTAEQVAQLAEETVLARQQLGRAVDARAASRAATTLLGDRVARMRQRATDLVRVVKGFAAMQPSPGAVFAAAQIPEPAAPRPAQPPGRPTGLATTLEPGGAITITWEARNAAAGAGAFFHILRKLPGEAGYSERTVAAGTTARQRRMSFTDASIPAGAAGAGVQYILRGRRGNAMGEPSEAISVHFGVPDAGTTIAGVAPSDGMKMAA